MGDPHAPLLPCSGCSLPFPTSQTTIKGPILPYGIRLRGDWGRAGRIRRSHPGRAARRDGGADRAGYRRRYMPESGLHSYEGAAGVGPGSGTATECGDVCPLRGGGIVRSSGDEEEEGRGRGPRCGGDRISLEALEDRTDSGDRTPVRVRIHTGTAEPRWNRYRRRCAGSPRHGLGAAHAGRIRVRRATDSYQHGGLRSGGGAGARSDRGRFCGGV